MTQAISVYISKAIFGPVLYIELGTTEVHDWCLTTIQIYGIKLLQLEILDVSYLFLYLVKNLQCWFNIVYNIVYRSELVNQNAFIFHYNWFHFNGNQAEDEQANWGAQQCALPLH